MLYTLEPAAMDDAALCMDILNESRQFQRTQGFVQWTDDYPGIDTIRSDIENNNGYLIQADGMAAGYLCLDFTGEPAYARIKGAWHSEQPYAVIHRLAICAQFREKGLADTAFALVKQRCLDCRTTYLRADTHSENKRMQHILTKNGFTACGIISLRGEERLAYDLKLSRETAR